MKSQPDRRIGKGGAKVRAIGLGAMPLSIRPDRPGEKDAVAVIRAAADGGALLIDTADSYCLSPEERGHNERIVALALRRAGARNGARVATKGGLRRTPRGWVSDAHPEALREACERSLRNLRTDCIFLYQLHAPDPKVPFEDSLGELARLRSEGKIRGIGLSNIGPAHLAAALQMTRIVSVQNAFNPFVQADLDNGLMRACAKEGVAYIAHSPVGGHWDRASVSGSRLLRGLARKYCTSPQNVALAWVLAQGEHVIAIPGASRLSSAMASRQASGLRLDDGDLARIRALGGKRRER